VPQLTANPTAQNINGGTYPTAAARAYVTTHGQPGDDAGHILAFVLGGGGGLRSFNIVPIDGALNRGAISTLVRNLAQLVRNVNNTVTVTVNLTYGNPALPRRPTQIQYDWTVNGTPFSQTFQQ
jgi:DNA/RNA non-specific endonuclease